MQEKFEVESAIYKISAKMHKEMSGIIFSLGKTEEKKFIISWLEPILNSPIDEISYFVRKKELVKISEEVLKEFMDLGVQNMAEYLSDEKSYVEAINKREKEFNGLIFKMRKELAA